VTGSITIRHNGTISGDTGEASASLSGNGTPKLEPRISVAGGGGFPDTILGEASAARSITVTNSGTLDLNVGGVSITPSNASTSAGDFSASSGCGTLAPSERCTITVVFTPRGAIGAKAANVNIPSNAVNTPRASVGVSGNALEIPAPRLAVSPAQAGFGTLPLNASAQQTITVSNAGSRPLLGTSVAISGVGFALTRNGCVGDLAVGGSCTLDVTFTASGTSSFSGSVSITGSNALAPAIVGLSGSGCTPATFAFRPGGFFVPVGCTP
jgi:hypothetical protein